MQTIATLVSLGCTIEIEPSAGTIAVIPHDSYIKIRIQDPNRDTLALYYARDAAEVEAKLAAYLKER